MQADIAVVEGGQKNHIVAVTDWAGGGGRRTIDSVVKVAPGAAISEMRCSTAYIPGAGKAIGVVGGMESSLQINHVLVLYASPR